MDARLATDSLPPPVTKAPFRYSHARFMASRPVENYHAEEPFGVELYPTDATHNTIKFTGQEEDACTGNLNLNFRMYQDAIGRFLKPDNVAGNPANPQSWNRYSYVRGNPVSMSDPSGHVPRPPGRGVGVFMQTESMSSAHASYETEYVNPGAGSTISMNAVMWDGPFVIIFLGTDQSAGVVAAGILTPGATGATTGTTSTGDPLLDMLRAIQLHDRVEVRYIIADVTPKLTFALFELGQAINFSGTGNNFFHWVLDSLSKLATTSSESSLAHYVQTGQITEFNAGHTHPRGTEYGSYTFYDFTTKKFGIVPPGQSMSWTVGWSGGDKSSMPIIKNQLNIANSEGRIPPLTSLMLIPWTGQALYW